MNRRSWDDFRIPHRYTIAPVAIGYFSTRRPLVGRRSAKWGQNFVDAPIDATEIGPAVRVVFRCVLATSTHDVSTNRTFIQMWQGTDDLMRSEYPVVPAQALSCGKDRRMNGFVVLPFTTVSDHLFITLAKRNNRQVNYKV